MKKRLTLNRRRFSREMLEAAVWALRARIVARRIIWREGIAVPLPLPTASGASLDATPAVIGVLGRTRATCLVRSVVLQRWFDDHGEPSDVVIGVTAPSDGFQAHAWLDRAGLEDSSGFTEIHRLAAPSIARAADRR